MIVDNLLEQIDKGRKGENWGLPIGMPKLETLIDGVCQSTYTLLFGGSGSGKTSFALYMYVYKPLVTYPAFNYKVIIYSLEMRAEVLFAKLLSIYIFEHYKKVITIKDIMSRKRDTILSDEDYELVKEASEWLRTIESKIIIWDKALNAKVFKSHLHRTLAKYGTFSESENRVIYTPEDPNAITVVMIDHIGLSTPSEGRTLKGEIDIISAIAANYRNRCLVSPLIISQVNREAQSMDRKKAGFEEFKRSDVKDSSNLEQDCDLMIGIFDPNREKLNTYREYSVAPIAQVLRGLILLKNRYDCGDAMVGTAFYGQCGVVTELPSPRDISDYSLYATPMWLVEEDVKQTKKDKQFNMNLTL